MSSRSDDAGCHCRRDSVESREGFSIWITLQADWRVTPKLRGEVKSDMVLERREICESGT
jgi:hypothetical protein